MAEDITPDVIKKTQKLLGKHVKKPALTDKLLKKPPFRFLHDIIITVIKDTGFLKGLFSVEELVSDNVKEKEAKVAFLNKLIDAVKNVTKTDLTVRASKIVAGLEPTKTNLLLQAIGKAIDDKVNTSEYVSQSSSRQIEATEKRKVKKSTLAKEDKGKHSKIKVAVKDYSTTKTTKTKKIGESPRSKTKTNTPKDSSRSKRKIDKNSKSGDKKNEEIVEEKEEIISEISPKQIEAESVPQKENEHISIGNAAAEKILVDNIEKDSQDLDTFLKEQDQADGKEEIKILENVFHVSKDNVTADSNGNEMEVENTKTIETKQVKNELKELARPKSARPKNKEENAVSKHMNDQEAFTPLQKTTNQLQRPKSSLRPPSVRPSSARPGAPRLRPDSALPLQETVTMGNIKVIVENTDNVDDEETVIIQTAPEIAEENFTSVKVSQDNKGQLVEQILEQIQEEGEGVKKKIDIDWEENALHNRDGAAKEINQLRTLIQTLTRTANPLGKLMNYLHEDIDAMHGELQMWTNIKNQLFSEIYKRKRLSAESNKPLLVQLEHLQEEIRKQQQEILIVRSNILRNELRIKELLNV